MSLIVIIFVIVVGFFGTTNVDEPDCGGGADGCMEEGTEVAVAPSQPWKPVQIGVVEGVIVAETDGPSFIGIEGYWTPDISDLTNAEAAITAAEGELDHRRQYVGFYEGGVPKVFINGFCDETGLDWGTQPVLVADGGECYFTAVYNMETDELERFSYNGEA